MIRAYSIRRSTSCAFAYETKAARHHRGIIHRLLENGHSLTPGPSPGGKGALKRPRATPVPSHQLRLVIVLDEGIVDALAGPAKTMLFRYSHVLNGQDDLMKLIWNNRYGQQVERDNIV